MFASFIKFRLLSDFFRKWRKISPFSILIMCQMKSLNIVGNEGCYLRRYSKIASLGSDKQKIRTFREVKSQRYQKTAR